MLTELLPLKIVSFGHIVSMVMENISEKGSIFSNKELPSCKSTIFP